MKFLVDIPEKQFHKTSFGKLIPLSGGLYFFVLFSFIILLNESTELIILLISLFPFLILGFFSDTKPNFSPKIRIILQLILIVIFIQLNKININESGIFFIDNFINVSFFNLVFTSFCILVLLNGSNFCDGVNGNVTGYYLSIILAVSFTNHNLPLNLEAKYLIIPLLTFYFFNIFSKCFLGDNGVYILSILFSIIAINFVNINTTISPILAVNLLWYPAYENLFTILRRLIYGKVIEKADKKHLHNLLFKFFGEKMPNNLFFSNSLSGISLNIFNFFGIFMSLNFFNNNQALVTIILCNIICYNLLYFWLLKNLPKSQLFKK